MYLRFVPVDVKCYCFARCHVCALLLFYVLLYYHNCSHTNNVQVNNSLKYTVWVLASLHHLSKKNYGKVFFGRISILLVPEPNVSILRVTVCTILDNDGIPTSDDSDDLLDFSNSCLFLAHVRSDDRHPDAIICWKSTSDESASMLSKNSLFSVCVQISKPSPLKNQWF